MKHDTEFTVSQNRHTHTQKAATRRHAFFTKIIRQTKNQISKARQSSHLGWDGSMECVAACCMHHNRFPKENGGVCQLIIIPSHSNGMKRVPLTKIQKLEMGQVSHLRWDRSDQSVLFQIQPCHVGIIIPVCMPRHNKKAKSKQNVNATIMEPLSDHMRKG
jgi:hypothetical protein